MSITCNLLREAIQLLSREEKPSEPEIGSRQELESAVQEYCNEMAHINVLNSWLNVEIQDAIEKYMGEARERAARTESLKQAVVTYCRKHKDELLPMKNGKYTAKSVDTGAAVIQFRKSPDRIDFDDEDSALAELKEKGFNACIITSEHVSKPAALALWPDLEKADISTLKLVPGFESILIKPIAD